HDAAHMIAALLQEDRFDLRLEDFVIERLRPSSRNEQEQSEGEKRRPIHCIPPDGAVRCGGSACYTITVEIEPDHEDPRPAISQLCSSPVPSQRPSLCAPRSPTPRCSAIRCRRTSSGRTTPRAPTRPRSSTATRPSPGRTRF